MDGTFRASVRRSSLNHFLPIPRSIYSSRRVCIYMHTYAHTTTTVSIVLMHSTTRMHMRTYMHTSRSMLLLFNRPPGSRLLTPHMPLWRSSSELCSALRRSAQRSSALPPNKAVLATQATCPRAASSLKQCAWRWPMRSARRVPSAWRGCSSRARRTR